MSAAVAVVEWLEAEREAVAAKAVLRGRPTSETFAVQELIWEALGNGYRIETSSVQGSPFLRSFGEFDVCGDDQRFTSGFKEAVEGLVDESGNGIAPDGSGPGYLQRYVDDDYLHRIAEDERVWPAAVHLFFARNHYLSRLTDLAVPDHQLATATATDLLAYERSETYLAVAATPIAGVATPQEVRVGALSVRPLTPREAARLHGRPIQDVRWDSPINGRWDDHMDAEERCVLEVRTPQPKSATSIPTVDLERALMAALVSDLPIASRQQTVVSWREPQWITGSTHLRPTTLPSKRAWVPPTDIGPAELEAVLALAELVPVGAVETPSKPADHSLRRFRLGLCRRDDADALVDLVVALEGLLLPAITVEQRWRFGIHGALFLAPSPEARQSTLDLCRSMYDARSSLVHGGKAPSQDTVTRLRPEAEKLARRGIARALREGWPDLKWFESTMLKATVDGFHR